MQPDCELATKPITESTREIAALMNRPRLSFLLIHSKRG